ncbi:MAG: kinase/pyrophosphorylase [Planctomycetes bacterium]|nr:kinase/pyrophosphorylase [Planctomycetota bacterium]
MPKAKGADPKERRYICVISDATGATADRVVRATLEQFDGIDVDLEIIPEVKTVAQLREIVSKVKRRKGLLAFTLVDVGMRSEVISLANEKDVTALDIMGPLLHALGVFLSATPAHLPGHRFDRADEDHYRLLEAVSFTVCHDDGQGLDELPLADIVVVGPSRVSKTPLCAYLAHTRGLKAANVPIALGIDPPEGLRSLPPRRVVGLTMNAHLLAEIRRARAQHLGAEDIRYAQLAYVERELHHAHEIYRRPPAWPVIDVTRKSIEEIATAVCAVTVDAPGGGREERT